MIYNTEFTFLSATDPTEEDLSDREIRKRTDPELMAPIQGPESQLKKVQDLWGPKASTSLENILTEFDDLFMKHKADVTAACPYPALRLDKLYAALIRCLVLWTVTKQILVFLFKGLHLLAGGSDVTRGISCDSSLH